MLAISKISLQYTLKWKVGLLVSYCHSKLSSGILSSSFSSNTMTSSTPGPIRGFSGFLQDSLQQITLRYCSCLTFFGHYVFSKSNGPLPSPHRLLIDSVLIQDWTQYRSRSKSQLLRCNASYLSIGSSTHVQRCRHVAVALRLLADG